MQFNAIQCNSIQFNSIQFLFIGTTCIVGAGYVALECAGFLAALKQGDIDICVRSILLRGFDREIVTCCEDMMKHHHMNIMYGMCIVHPLCRILCVASFVSYPLCRILCLLFM
jgi:hypothetical protein